MKHVVMFSGGIQSAYMAYLVKQKERKEDIILLFCDTKIEDCDNARFRQQVAEYLDLKLYEIADGRSLWELIDEKQHFPTFHVRFCTQILKIKPRQRFLRQLDKEGYITYLGFGLGEYRRIQKYTMHALKDGHETRFPLFDARISTDRIKQIINDEWRIKIPHCYQIFPHANCVPCFLGGKTHFYQIWKFYPEIWEKLKRYEEKFSYHIHGKFLKDYEAEFADPTYQHNFEDVNYVPCECFNV